MLAGLIAVLISAQAGSTRADPFLALSASGPWGFSRGIQVAVHPVRIAAGGPVGGPRGLLRIGYPILPGGGVSLINFIAVEPLVGGRRAFSELERSADGVHGKLMVPGEPQLSGRHGYRRLTVPIAVERFANGSHVRLEITFDAAQPDEVELRAHAEPDSAEMQECVLTATMGNYGRLRRVHLAERKINSWSAYSTYMGMDFAPDIFLPASTLARTPSGDILIPACPDEYDLQASQQGLPPGTFWRYPGMGVTQYWRAPRETFSPALKLRLNARGNYYLSDIAIPGGMTFENFELRDRFRSGQPFIFGVSHNAPELLLSPPPRLDDREREWLAGWN